MAIQSAIQEQEEHEDRDINLALWERLASLAASAAVTAWGKSRVAEGNRVTGWVLMGIGSALGARGASGKCPVKRMWQERTHSDDVVEAKAGVTVMVPRDEVFRFLRRQENLARFMEHVDDVRADGDRRATYTLRAMGKTFVVESEIVEEVSGERIVWASVPGAEVEHRRVVELRDSRSGEGTEISLTLTLMPPASGIVVPLFGRLAELWTENTLSVELIRMRQLLETGEIATGARIPEKQAAKERNLVGREPLITNVPAVEGKL
jgi:uncharacterized membrane protein